MHTALREFNDLSAAQVFTSIVAQMQEMQDMQKAGPAGGNIALGRRATLAPRSKAESLAGSFGVGGVGSTSGVSNIAGPGGATGTAGGSVIKTSMGNMSVTSMVGLESLEVDEQTADDIINNVEKMIAAEKNKDKIAKKDKKADEKTLNLTDLPGAVSGKADDKSKSATASGKSA